MGSNSIDYYYYFFLKESLFIFVCLANKSSSNISLDLTIKWTKLKHNNAFINKKNGRDTNYFTKNFTNR